MIRASGPDSIHIAGSVISKDLASWPSRMAKWVRLLDDTGEVIDDGVLTIFRAPASYTGEDTVEFSGHGGMVVTRLVLERFLQCGARLAEPGEFTRRAFLNGKLDLTQAEAVMDLISAQTELARKAARNQMDGMLGRKTLELRDDLLGTLAEMEAWIDFPDEDISPDVGEGFSLRLDGVSNELTQMLDTADQGRILREGVRTVIVGAPNVGKSSLLNRLLGFERAIVSETAGTTRDTIEEVVNVGGIPLRLVDTAGIRDAKDEIEAEGIERTLKQLDKADLVLEMVDASEERDIASLVTTEAAHLLILNKTDLPVDESWKDVAGLRVSCKNGDGFDVLAAALREVLSRSTVDWGDQLIAINSRHQGSLAGAKRSILAAQELIRQKADAELIAIDLRDALQHLGEIPGKLDTEDLLGEIFGKFCIGK